MEDLDLIFPIELENEPIPEFKYEPLKINPGDDIEMIERLLAEEKNEKIMI